MSEVVISNSAAGITQLQAQLMSENIAPGSEPSYQLCKLIYEFHPLGAKIVHAPIDLAQSRPRVITVGKGPESRMRDAYLAEWKRLGVDKLIANVMALSQVYGISSVGYLIEGVSNQEPVDPFDLWKHDLYFNVWDSLNTAGSLVLNQNPVAIDFLKNTDGLSVMGRKFHPSRTCIMMNEGPIYLAYTTSAYGFVGRSAYQRALLPLKSFIQTMTTDDMVSRKAGLLVAKIKQAGSIINNLMQKATGAKRFLLKEAETDNVISISPEEEVAAIDLQNIDKAMTAARKNIIENIATASGRPAKLLLQESFAEGFGEGSEDMRLIAQFVNKFREVMEPLYAYFDDIVQHRAWSPEFFASIQAEYPEYEGRDYRAVFIEWRDSFKAVWPSLLEEPESELVKVDKEKLEGIKSVLEALLPSLDPANKAELIKWAMDNLNEMKERMFKHPMNLDIEALKEYTPPEIELQQQGQEFEQSQAKAGAGQLKVAK